ncbi:MAG TPA: ABC transporter, partial [Candidatus Hydrogenedentes bacterium]|nr:ABC transporter [Candidatus Hydrogenedentota bacterium]
MSVDWKWNGARWWRFEFHTHTPASNDYGKGPDQAVLKKRTHREWLLDYMRAGMDCVAVTDHNSGERIDELKNALAKLNAEAPQGYHPLHLFPGVEISVNGGIHVLAVLGTEKGTRDIDLLLGAVGFQGAPGKSDDVTQRSFVEVVNAIKDAGGIAIPAHVDEANGLFTLEGTTLQQALRCEEITAVEMIDPACEKPQIYSSSSCQWTEVLGSDAHHPSGNSGQQYPGSRFTWVKMGAPSIEGLRLALMDGPLSILRSDAATDDPNAYPNMLIESVHVENARYMGRPAPLEIQMNPWLNAVIGGRGTGKSTLVEFQRIAFRRRGELPEGLMSDFEKYEQVYTNRDEGGLLTNEAAIRVIYRKDGVSYRIQWSPDGSLESIQERSGEDWIRADGDIRQRFPVRMYSQKQIFHLARDPLALVSIINDAPDVDFAGWKRRFDAKENQYLALRAKIREIQAGLSEESRLKGELEDVKRKLAIFEQSGHADILKTLQKRRRQANAITAWESGLKGMGQRLRETAEVITPDSLDETSFDSSEAEDAQVLALIQEMASKAESISADLVALAERADAVEADWMQRKQVSAWQEATNAAIHTYEELQERLKAKGVTDLSEYGTLVQRRQTIEQQIKELADRRIQIEQLEIQANSCLDEIRSLRGEITELRRNFLDSVLDGNPYVRISVVAFGARELVEAQFRAIIRREGGGFEKDIGTPGGGGLLGPLNGNGSMKDSLDALKRTIRE